MCVQLVYTALGRLGQQLLMVAVDAAVQSNPNSLQLDHVSDQACLPDCIELFRMLDQQVCLAACLVSSCKASILMSS